MKEELVCCCLFNGGGDVIWVSGAEMGEKMTLGNEADRCV